MKTKNYWIFFFVLFAATACKKSNEQQNTSFNSNKKVIESNVSSTIQFSGYTWNVKNSGSELFGPGPNFWNEQNVWVDSNGWLHLKLSFNTTTNRWECAEVQSTQTFGYGTYQWQLEGPVNTMDKGVVLGLFNYSGKDGLDEMDIEFARWGVQANDPLNYTVYPARRGKPTFHTALNPNMGGTSTTHRFKRTKTSVVFKSLSGFHDDDTNLFSTASCLSPSYSISTLSMPVYMNLWLFQGLAPANNTSVEIVIHSFKFTP